MNKFIIGPRGGISRTPGYNSWRAMLARCCNPSHHNYPDWGGKGVQVCKRWLSFRNFMDDMGARPEGKYSIDRIDGNGNYEPGNCRWASAREQAENRPSFNRMLTLNGTTQSMAAWARQYGISREALKYRLDSGWDLQTALTTPSGDAARKDSKLGIKGVSVWGRKFRARKYVNGRAVHLGLFDTEQAAQEAVKRGGQ